MWFQNKRLQKQSIKVETDSGVEVVAHKRATKRTIEQTKKVNEQLNKLLVANGFTLKIYLSTRNHKNTDD